MTLPGVLCGAFVAGLGLSIRLAESGPALLTLLWLWRLRDPAVRASQLWPLAAPVLALNAVTVASEPLSGHRRGGGGQEEHRARAAIRQLPAERTAERALVVGSIAVITGFLIGGLSEYNLGDSEVVMVVWVIMALPSSAGEASIA